METLETRDLLSNGRPKQDADELAELLAGPDPDEVDDKVESLSDENDADQGVQLIILHSADDADDELTNGKSLLPEHTVEPTALTKFEQKKENAEEKNKRNSIETALNDAASTLATWKHFATTEYGLINDDLRRQVWPLLVGIDPQTVERAPTLDQLRHHPEYNQVILDVNRSLKRFPPGIPYEQRIALQDQLTILILRVIIKYPHLRYYQGYHDVAVTFLLVVGDEIAFHVMEILSTHHLVECMQETMEPTQRRLMYLYPLVRHERPALCDYLERSTVGTLFALPWFLTWFGHSLNSYRDVVRLYDYFLASEYLLPIYVTAAIVLYREDDVFKEDCDMASMHCVLSRLPENLPFEYIMRQADELYRKYPPEVVEREVDEMIVREKVHVALRCENLSNVIPILSLFPDPTQTRRRGGRRASPSNGRTSSGGAGQGECARLDVPSIRADPFVDATLGVRDDGLLDIRRHLCVLLQIASGRLGHQLRPRLLWRTAAPSGRQWGRSDEWTVGVRSTGRDAIRTIDRASLSLANTMHTNTYRHIQK